MFEQTTKERLKERRLLMKKTMRQWDPAERYGDRIRFRNSFVDELKKVIADNRRKQYRGSYQHSRKGKLLRRHAVKLGSLPTNVTIDPRDFVLVVAQTQEQVAALAKRKGYAEPTQLQVYKQEVLERYLNENNLTAESLIDDLHLKHTVLASHFMSRPVATIYLLTGDCASARDAYDNIRDLISPVKLMFVVDYMWIHSDDGWECVRARYGKSEHW